MTQIISTQYLKDTLKLKNDIEGAFIQLGERLYKIKKEELWMGTYNNFSEFLEDMGISDGHASKLVQVYARFVLEYGLERLKLAQFGIRKLYAILPICTDKKGVIKALEDIKGLSSADVERTAKQKQIGAHKHQDIKCVMCTVCKRVKRVYGDIE